MPPRPTPVADDEDLDPQGLVLALTMNSKDPGPPDDGDVPAGYTAVDAPEPPKAPAPRVTPPAPATAPGPDYATREANLMASMEALGHPIVRVSGTRTADQQAALYAKGRSAPGKVVTEKSGKPGDESLHQRGQATDYAFKGPDGKPDYDPKLPWDTLGRMAKLHGFDWGGDWQDLKDLGHVQVTPPSETTALTPKEEEQFQAWAVANTIKDLDHPDSHYDYRGYWKDTNGAVYPPPAGAGHGPDTYKQHGHETFSVESKYSTGPGDGGHWDGDTFIPQAQAPGQAPEAQPSDVPAGFTAVDVPAGYTAVDAPSTGPKPTPGPPLPWYRQLGDTMAENLPMVLGATGAMLGGTAMVPTAVVSGPIGPAGGAVAGAAIGGFAGDQLRQLYRSALGIEPHPDWASSLGTSGTAGAGQGAWEVFGQAPIYAAAKALSGAGAQTAIRATRGFGLNLSAPEQLTTHGFQTWVQRQVTRASGVAQAVASRAQRLGDEAAIHSVENALAKLDSQTRTFADIGTLAEKARTAAKAGFRNYPALVGGGPSTSPLNDYYNYVKRTGPNIDLRPIVKDLMDLFKREGTPVDTRRLILRMIPPPLTRQVGKFASTKAWEVTFEQAAALRGMVSRKGRAVGDLFAKPGAQAIATKLYGDLSMLLKAASPDFASVSRLYREKMAALSAPVMRTVLKTSPETIVQALGRTPKDSTVRALRDAFLDLAQHSPDVADHGIAADAWDAIRRKWFETYILRNGRDLPGMVQRLRDMNGTLQTMYGGDQAGRTLITTAGEIAEALGRRLPTSGEGHTGFIRTLSTLLGAGAGAATTGNIPAAALYGAGAGALTEFGSGFIMWLMHNPTAAKLYIQGLKTLSSGEARTAWPVVSRVLLQYLESEGQIDPLPQDDTGPHQNDQPVPAASAQSQR